jgi:hypothetical protein
VCVQVWDPELGLLLHSLEMTAGLPLLQPFRTGSGRNALATGGSLIVWDLGEAPPEESQIRSAKKT